MDLSKCRAQTLAYNALKPGNTVCLAFGRGIGKSFLTRLFWYLLVAQWDGVRRAGMENPGVRIVLLMPTLKQAKKVHAELMEAELSRNGKWGFLGGKVNKTDWKISFPGGSVIQWVSAENANDNRGIRCDFVCVDEADDIDPEVVQSITMPWLSEPFSLKMTVIVGTPRRGRYGLLYEAYKSWPSPEWWLASKQLPREKALAKAAKHHSFHATAYDAPLLVDPDYLEDVRVKTPLEVFKREWLCDFDAAEGLVYPMFRADFHIRQPTLQFHTFLVGVDHGFEDPAVFIVVGVAGYGRDAVCHVVREYYKSHKTISDLSVEALDIRDSFPNAKWFADPSRPDTIDEYRKRGIRVNPAMNSIEDGVLAVADKLAIRESDITDPYAKLYVSPNCPNTIEEFGKYRRKRDPRNKERILDDIEDKNNHAMDALRYAIFSYFGGPSKIRHELRDYDDSEQYPD